MYVYVCRLYFAGLMLNGLFSGAYVIVMSFFLNLLPKEEQAAPVRRKCACSYCPLATAPKLPPPSYCPLAAPP